LVALREHIKETIHVSEQIKHYIVAITRATRQPERYPGLQDLRGTIRLGASPRGGTLNLRKACRVRAFLQGRTYVLPDDVKAVAPDILRHRLILELRAEREGIEPDEIISLILDKVEIP
jgi:MoxR-like ATPase